MLWNLTSLIHNNNTILVCAQPLSPTSQSPWLLTGKDYLLLFHIMVFSDLWGVSVLCHPPLQEPSWWNTHYYIYCQLEQQREKIAGSCEFFLEMTLNAFNFQNAGKVMLSWACKKWWSRVLSFLLNSTVAWNSKG